jgi:hypothetical protein
VSSDATSVVVNGVAASVGAGTWSASVPLAEGNETITAVAMHAMGNAST